MNRFLPLAALIILFSLNTCAGNLLKSAKTKENYFGNLIPYAQPDSAGDSSLGYLWGYADEDTGEIVIEAKYAYAEPFIGDFAVVQKTWHSNSLIIDKNEKIIINGGFDKAFIIQSENGKCAVAVLRTGHSRKKFDLGLRLFGPNESPHFYDEDYNKYRLVNLKNGKTIIGKKENYLTQNIDVAGDYLIVNKDLYQFMNSGEVKLIVKDDVPRAISILKDYFNSRGINAEITDRGQNSRILIDYRPYIKELFNPIPDFSSMYDFAPEDNMVFNKAHPFFRDHRLFLNTSPEIKEIKYMVYYSNKDKKADAVGIYNKTKEEWEITPSFTTYYIDEDITVKYFVQEIAPTNNPDIYRIYFTNEEIGWDRMLQRFGGLYNYKLKKYMEDWYLFQNYPPGRASSVQTFGYTGHLERLIHKFPMNGVYYRDYGRIKNRTPQTAYPYREVTFSNKDNNIAAFAYSDHSIRIFDIDADKELHILKGHTDRIRTISFSPDGKLIASAADDAKIKIWDIVSGKEITTLNGHRGNVLSVSFSPDAKFIASGGSDNTVRLWDIDAEEGRIFIGKDDKWSERSHSGRVSSVSFSPDGRFIASGAGEIKIWDAASGNELLSFETDVSSVAFNPNGRTIASSSHYSTIHLWDIYTGKELRTLKGHGSNVFCVSFSNDGKFIVSGSSDDTVKLWDADNGRLLRTFKGHTDMVVSVSFSSDGKRILSGSHDKTARLWDATTGKEIRVYK